MKKILTLVILFIAPLAARAQLSGNGTYASPYSGTLNQDVTWSSDVYIGGDIISSAYTLTINQGVRVIFTATGSDIIIQGTGRLVANGSAGSLVRFTADNNNNGIYGEAGERWGHITFQSMGSAGASVINFCIIEFGDVSSSLLLPANPNQYGGAIHADFSNLTVSNCEIRNCAAGLGGGIYTGNSRNPLIANCYIHDNSAVTGGGGLFFTSDSYSTVTNCIITFNSISGTGGGGGIYLGNKAGNVNLINCVISSNTASSVSEGHNIHFNNNTSNPRPKFVNSIIWNPAGSIVYQNGGNSQATDFEYCAIQTPPATYTNCLTLNSSNSATDGPNFTDPDMPGLDWSISFSSPCRDAGTSPVPAVPADFNGSPRIGIYDIGTYEVQYSRWLTNATTPSSWFTAGNWELGLEPGHSGTTGDVVIPYLASAAYAPNIAGTVTIPTGRYLVLEPGAKATFTTLSNNGTLKLNSSTAYLASLILNNYIKVGGSNEQIQLYLTGGGSKTSYRWHYISSPVTNLPVSTFAPAYTLNVAQWVEPKPSLSLAQGWVAFDGYDYSTGLMGGPTFSVLAPGTGYDFYRATSATYTFGGQLNTGDVAVNLSYKAGNNNIWGYNLIGNPFSSGLDWDYITSHSFPANTTRALYLTRNNVLCTYSNGVGIPGDVTGILPPMQGFFSKTYSAGNTIVLAAAARTHSNIHPTYKGASIIPLVRLALTDDSLSDETVVRFDDLAKPDLDNDFDAVKMFLAPDLTTICTSLSGTDYAINGQPFPETYIEIPVNVNITTDAATKTMTASQLQGLENYTVTLKDNSTGFNTDLKASPVITFAAPKGTLTGRFILRISSQATGVEKPLHPDNSFNVYQSDDCININPLSDEWDGESVSVRLLDLTGKTVALIKDLELRKNSPVILKAPRASGLYVIEIKSGVKRYVAKVVIR